MYTFCIERGHFPLLKVTVINNIVEKDDYFRSLIEKCFERTFQIIKDENKKEEVNSSEEIDLEEDD